jgi:hypothetical protein
MIHQILSKILLTIALVFLSTILGSNLLTAATKLGTEVGGQAIFTAYDGILEGIANCEDTTIDRRIGLSLLPTGKWSDSEMSLVLGMESQISNESEVTPFHRIGKATLNRHLGRHGLGLSFGYDDSQQVLWGCAASVAARLKREQRIREDLQVAGDRTRTLERSLRYDFNGNVENLSLIASDSREEGDYKRSQTDLMLSFSRKISSIILTGIRAGIGDEAIRDERYRNIRGGSNLLYKLTGRTTIAGDLASQRRGNLQKITTWEAKADHQYNKEILGSLIASRVLSNEGPRFSTKSFRMVLSRIIGSSETRLDAGKMEVDNPKNANNIIGISHSNQISRRHRYYLRVSEGTDFVAVVKTTKVAEVRYNLMAIPEKIGNSGNSLLLGISINRTWLVQSDRQDSQVSILELSMMGRF